MIRFLPSHGHTCERLAQVSGEVRVRGRENGKKGKGRREKGKKAYPMLRGDLSVIM